MKSAEFLNFIWFLGTLIVVFSGLFFITSYLLNSLSRTLKVIYSSFLANQLLAKNYEPIIIKSKSEFKQMVNHIDENIRNIQKLNTQEDVLQKDIHAILRE